MLHPDLLLEKLTPVQFDEWMAYSLVEPFGEEWRQTGEQCAATLNAQGGKKGGGLFTAYDFGFLPKEPVSEEDVAALEAARWKAWAMQFRNQQEGSVVSHA